HIPRASPWAMKRRPAAAGLEAVRDATDWLRMVGCVMASVRNHGHVEHPTPCHPEHPPMSFRASHPLSFRVFPLCHFERSEKS
ncbi:MAG: hypothetical protein ACP5LD_06710, partial [Desulfomonilaceae bacterium]